LFFRIYADRKFKTSPPYSHISPPNTIDKGSQDKFDSFASEQTCCNSEKQKENHENKIPRLCKCANKRKIKNVDFILME
ncbi:MAG: hypothetical protein AAB318_06070, partial [Planctomycetota bacterium]